MGDATGRFDGGWTVEAAVPFKSLRYPPGTAQVWGFNALRVKRSQASCAATTCAATTRDSSSARGSRASAPPSVEFQSSDRLSLNYTNNFELPAGGRYQFDTFRAGYNIGQQRKGRRQPDRGVRHLLQRPQDDVENYRRRFSTDVGQLHA